jgi:hypothetical protein
MSLISIIKIDNEIRQGNFNEALAIINKEHQDADK